MGIRVMTFLCLPPDLYRLLGKHAEVTVWNKKRPPTVEELKEIVGQYDALLTTPQIIINNEIIKVANRTKLFSQYAVGHENLDIDMIHEYGLLATYTPGILNETVAQFTMGLILALTRKIVEGNQYVKAGKWKKWGSERTLWGQNLDGKRLAILGLGRIGRAVALLAKSFKLDIYYHNRRPSRFSEEITGAKYCTFDELLKNADILSIHLPLTPQTTNLIRIKHLRMMPQGSYLVNVARGPIVHTDSLVKALNEKHLAGAALDVTDPEPLPHNHPLCEMDNVILTPHLGSATHETRYQMAELAVKNIVNVITGNPPLTPIKKER
ncbi:MAG: 2-hydroxyacid dehydrogenase [Candidatus Ranarchaeia archaeon]